jgi:hypothetical protein
MSSGLNSYFWQPYFSLKLENNPGVLSCPRLELNLQKILIFNLIFLLLKIPGRKEQLYNLQAKLDPKIFD